MNILFYSTEEEVVLNPVAILERLGHTVYSVTTETAALNVLRAYPIDAIIANAQGNAGQVANIIADGSYYRPAYVFNNQTRFWPLISRYIFPNTVYYKDDLWADFEKLNRWLGSAESQKQCA